MVWQFNPLAIPLFLGTIPLIRYSLLIWQHRADETARWFLLYTLSATGLLITYALELLSADLATMLIWLRLEYLFSLPIPIYFVLFVLSYTGYRRHFKRQHVVLLFVIPVMHILTMWTNEFHNLNWQTTGVIEINGLMMFDRTYGPIFWIGIVYLYSVNVAAVIIMIVWLFRSPHLYRGQLASLIAGMVLIWAGSILTITGATIIPRLDLTPFGYALAVIPVALSLFRYKLIDLMPAAHEIILKVMSDAVLVIDSQDRIVDLNPAAEKLLAVRAAHVVGKKIGQVFSNSIDLIERYKDVTEAQGELEYVQDGKPHYFDLRISPIPDQERQSTARVIVLRDISRLKETETANQRFVEELKERNSELDAFGHTIAHDLKTPISSIIGYAELLIESEHIKPHAQEVNFAKNILISSQKTITMIDELLRLSSLRDVGSEIEIISITAVVDAAVHRFSKELESRGIQMQIMPNLPPALGQETWIEEVFANLISNAIKYIGKNNPTPQITISGQLVGDKARYEVKDNGLGIQPADQPKLFQASSRFHKAEASGLGLGLTIASRIVHRLGGEIGAESTPGQGSTFWFTLPVPPQTQAPINGLHPADLDSVNSNHSPAPQTADMLPTPPVK
jgi:PAS domain S-box-containing protein